MIVRVWLFLSLLAVVPAADAQLFEFMDDFGKPIAEQLSDPFEERIETDRHDFTQSAVTVGQGVVQLEAGYSFFRVAPGESAHTFPETLLRLGLSEDIEFRLRYNNAWVFGEEEGARRGAEDLRYTLKLQITRQPDSGLLPTSALEVRGTAPTGSEDLSTRQAELGLDYIYEWQIADSCRIAGSTGYTSQGLGEFGLLPEEPAGDRFNVLSQSVAVGLELSESNTLYAEWFGLYSGGLHDEFAISVFNLGIDHYMTNNLVVDVRAGVGLSDDSDDFFVGFGGGYRY